MKRRNFLAGLIAAPVAVAAAPELAKAEATYTPRTATETMILNNNSLMADYTRKTARIAAERRGFTAQELRMVADGTTHHYANKASHLSPAQLRALAGETI